jgi:hypothetical protein
MPLFSVQAKDMHTEYVQSLKRRLDRLELDLPAKSWSKQLQASMLQDQPQLARHPRRPSAAATRALGHAEPPPSSSQPSEKAHHFRISQNLKTNWFKHFIISFRKKHNYV